MSIIQEQIFFPFNLNFKRSSHVLELVDCNLSGPSPVSSTHDYRYYAIFVDEFFWVYLVLSFKIKSGLYGVRNYFFTFVQTQFSCRLNSFQFDGGKEFVYEYVISLFFKNNTHHMLSYPYTPYQNVRAKKIIIILRLFLEMMSGAQVLNS